MGDIKDFKDLRVWQNGIVIVKTIYSLTSNFPKSEMFGLINQMRRASVSIPSNIAEGHIKNSTKEFLRYLRISLGSSAELQTQSLISKELGFLSSEDYESLSELLLSEIKQLNALIKRLSES